MDDSSRTGHRGLRLNEAGGLLLLASIWGASFLFIKVALEEIGPLAVVAARVIFAAVGLTTVLLVLRGRAGVGALLRGVDWRRAVLLSITASAVPFFLIAWAETRISSSLAGILNASVPLFAAVLAIRLDPIGRIRGWRTIGLAIGFAGVALVAGTDLAGGSLGVLAMLGASLSYAISAHYAKAHFAHVRPVGVALVQVLTSSAIVVPLALVLDRPSSVPSADVLGALAALGLGGTAIAWVLYYWLVSSAGPQQAVAVTYLVPIAALFYGAVVLDEYVAAAAVLGTLVIVAGQVVTAAPARKSGEPEPVVGAA
jgi:drug/metabolite transporter (DMT)-like permease